MAWLEEARVLAGVEDVPGQDEAQVAREDEELGGGGLTWAGVL